MDLANLISAGGLGAVSVGGTLLAVVVYLLNANRVDRREYQDAIDRAETRADAAENRKREADAEAEAERVKRRAAEDKADALAREVASLRSPGHGGAP